MRGELKRRKYHVKARYQVRRDALLPLQKAKIGLRVSHVKAQYQVWGNALLIIAARAVGDGLLPVFRDL